MVGHNLSDLGNFLRFEDEDYTPELVSVFLAGYQSINGPLPEQWKLASQLLDLVSLCFFLNRKEELSKTFATAKASIEKIIYKST